MSALLSISYLSLEHRVFLVLDSRGLFSIVGFGFLSHAVLSVCVELVLSGIYERNEVVDECVLEKWTDFLKKFQKSRLV